MNRRDILKGFGALVLCGSLPGVMDKFAVAAANKVQIKPQFFSKDEFALLENVVNVILPKTKTPGGLETQVPAFIDLVVKDCMSKDDQTSIVKGLNSLINVKGKSFLKHSKDDKTAIIKSIDEKAFANDAESVWFRALKKIALIGYFTSRDGVTKAQNYLKVAGDYEGCIPYKKGDKAMAKTFLIY